MTFLPSSTDLAGRAFASYTATVPVEQEVAGFYW